MGLDMYLRAKESYWDHMDEGKMKKKLLAIEEFQGIDCQYVEVCFDVIYWGKANAIHGWFVRNIQKGEDDCGEYYVPREKLKELLKLCEETLASKETGDLEAMEEMDNLEPMEGFFFGSYEKDELYWDDIKQTIKDLRKVLTNHKLDNFEFYYRASW